MIRHRVIAVGLAVILVGLVLGGMRVVEHTKLGSILDRARREAASGRFAEARADLLSLPTSRASDPEVADLLGVCEHVAGNYEAALAAWSRIPTDSPLATRAALARARTLVGDLGRFADAEAILDATLPDAGRDRLEVRHTLSQLYFWESRPEAMRRVILDGWRAWRDPVAELRDLWLIDDATILVDSVRETVEAAARRAPDDDRVLLAQAGLDLMTGHPDDARRKLDDCIRRCPDDPVVWLARLRLARATDDLAEAERTLPHIAGDALTEADRLDLLAWFASRRGDSGGQRKALEARAEVGPADPAVLERLAVLAWESGQTALAAELRRRKAELDATKDRYRRLLNERPPAGRFEELATLAEALNRPFEAYQWWDLAERHKPGDSAPLAALARLKAHRDPERSAHVAGTLAGTSPMTSPSAARPTSRVAVVPRFRDDAASAGLRFIFDNGRSPLRQIPEIMSGGVCLLDYDGDGWLDVYLVQGGPFPPSKEQLPAGDRLYRNKGDGTFEDATERSGVAKLPQGYGHGVAVGDVDNDGRPDLFITRWGAYALYRNKGDGTFEDVTDRFGLGGDRGWPTSAAFADLDDDGDLDLYVCHYCDWDAEHPTLCGRKLKPGEPADPARRYDYCMPNPIPSLPDHLFRNDGGQFIDVTGEAGIIDANGRGLGVVANDVDCDGRIDLFVANDTTANYLFHNLGKMKFEEVGVGSGVACNAQGAFQAGMGTASADLDGDGLPDLCVTNFYGESTTFFKNLGRGMFADRTAAIGLAAPSRFLLGFGLVLFDANDDGRLDLASADGHVVDDRPNAPLEMPCQLLVGTPDGRLADVTREAGPPWSVPRLHRALASADLDNDGRLDLLAVAQNSPLVYFHNATEGGHSVTLRLEGTKSNRDAVGASVTVEAGGRTSHAWRTGGGSYLSASDPRIHVGLGGAARVDSVEVRWPSGRVDVFTGLGADRGYRLREGDPAAAPLAGFRDGRNSAAR